MTKYKRCKGCRSKIQLDKQNHYIAVSRDGSTMFANKIYFDAIDCPFCGCQNILRKRMMIES